MRRLLAEEVRVGVVFKRQCGENAAGDKAEMALWLALPLLRRGAVAVRKTPREYSDWARGMATADAAALDLGATPFWYEAGRALAEATGDMALSRALSSALLRRTQAVYDAALSIRGEDPAPFASTLSAAERALFAAAHDDSSAFEQWKDQEPRRVSSKRPRP